MIGDEERGSSVRPPQAFGSLSHIEGDSGMQGMMHYQSGRVGIRRDPEPSRSVSGLSPRKARRAAERMTILKPPF